DVEAGLSHVFVGQFAHQQLVLDQQDFAHAVISRTDNTPALRLRATLQLVLSSRPRRADRMKPLLSSCPPRTCEQGPRPLVAGPVFVRRSGRVRQLPARRAAAATASVVGLPSDNSRPFGKRISAALARVSPSRARKASTMMSVPAGSEFLFQPRRSSALGA